MTDFDTGRTVDLANQRFTLEDADCTYCQPLCSRPENRNMPPGMFRDIYDTIMANSKIVRMAIETPPINLKVKLD